MKTTFATEFASAAKQGPRLFFAPLVGAINAVRSEVQRISKENSGLVIVGKDTGARSKRRGR